MDIEEAMGRIVMLTHEVSVRDFRPLDVFNFSADSDGSRVGICIIPLHRHSMRFYLKLSIKRKRELRLYPKPRTGRVQLNSFRVWLI